MMTVRQRRWLAASLATGLVLALVFIASFDLSGNQTKPERFVLTEVATFEAPPPPPPPPPRPSNRPAGGSTGNEPTLRSSRAPVSLETMNLNVQFAADCTLTVTITVNVQMARRGSSRSLNAGVDVRRS